VKLQPRADERCRLRSLCQALRFFDEARAESELTQSNARSKTINPSLKTPQSGGAVHEFQTSSASLS